MSARDLISHLAPGHAVPAESVSIGVLIEWSAGGDELAQWAEDHLCSDHLSGGATGHPARVPATHLADDGEDTPVCRSCLLARWAYGYRHCADADESWSDWIRPIDSRLIGRLID